MSADQYEPDVAVMSSDPPSEKCGTYYGAQLHRKRGETPCEACRSANAAYMRGWRAQPEGRRRHLIDVTARRLAHQALAKTYPRDYQRLFVAERDKLIAQADMVSDSNAASRVVDSVHPGSET